MLVLVDNFIGIKTLPAQYRITTKFLRASDAYAARQMQGAIKLIFLKYLYRFLTRNSHYERPDRTYIA
jgi:hypothetical protein